MYTGPDLNTKTGAYHGPWFVGGGWKGWRKDLERLNTGCAREGTGTPPGGEPIALEHPLFFRPISFDTFSLCPVHEWLGLSSASFRHPVRWKFRSNSRCSEQKTRRTA